MSQILKRGWGLALVAFLALVASFAFADTAKANDSADYYRGYTTHYPSADGTIEMYRIAPWNRDRMGHIGTNGDFPSEPAFCFNMDLQPPSSIDNREHVEYQRSYDLREAANKGPKTTPRIDDSAEFTAAVVKVIYNGFGYNASHIKERFQLTENEFYRATQHAVWYYTDSRFATNDEVPSAQRLAGQDPIRVGQAAQAMLGFGDVELTEPPADATLTVYNTEQTYRDGRQFQNLLTVTIRHGEDGPPIKKPGAPSMATQVTANGQKSSSAAPAEVAATSEVTVVDTVKFTNFEAGEEYTFKGELVDVSEGNKVVATAQLQQVVEKANGTVEVDFGRVENLQPGHTYVVFESAVRSDNGEAVEGAPVVEHKDAEDKAQTFVITPKPVVPEEPEVDEPEVPETDEPEVPEVPEPQEPQEPEVPEVEVPETDKPEVPEVEVPETDKPEVPEVEVPETDKPEVPEVEVPESDEPQADQPESKTPSTQGNADKPVQDAPKAAPKTENKAMLANTGVNVTMAIVAGIVLVGAGLAIIRRRSNSADSI